MPNPTEAEAAYMKDLNGEDEEPHNAEDGTPIEVGAEEFAKTVDEKVIVDEGPHKAEFVDEQAGARARNARQFFENVKAEEAKRAAFQASQVRAQLAWQAVLSLVQNRRITEQYDCKGIVEMGFNLADELEKQTQQGVA